MGLIILTLLGLKYLPGWVKLVWLFHLRTNGDVYNRYGQGWGALTVNPKQAAVYGQGDSRRQASIIDCQQLQNYEQKYIADQREYTGYARKRFNKFISFR